MHTRTHIHTHLHRSVRTENYLPLDDAVLLLGVYSPWRTALNWTFVDDDLSNHLPSLSFSFSLSLSAIVPADRQPRKHLRCGDQVMIVIRAALHCTVLTRDIFVRSAGASQAAKKEVVEKKRKERRKRRNSGKASSDQTPRLTFADNNSRLD